MAQNSTQWDLAFYQGKDSFQLSQWKNHKEAPQEENLVVISGWYGKEIQAAK